MSGAPEHRRRWSTGRFTLRLTLLLIPGAVAMGGVALRGRQQIATTLTDFFLPGSQPNSEVLYTSFRQSNNCRNCHGLDEDAETELAIYAPWRGSMMGQAARDPLFYACLAIANQDAAFAGDICIRCHTPGGWLSGRSSPSDGSALIDQDRDGVSCSVCHRMVDPVFKPGISPPSDATILANLAALPLSPGSGNYVMEPENIYRGPRPDPMTPGHAWLPSPFHKTAELCATCHDVSNPIYTKQPNGAYAMNLLDTEHETFDKSRMFPIERTYSEWLKSDFAALGVDMGGRFGGNRTVVRTCQDCHMPAVEGRPAYNTDERTDLPSHDFAGGNAWVQDMVLNLYPGDGLEAVHLDAGKARSVSMLQRAATLEVDQAGRFLQVRVINETGHKLPTGYPEGRRMWLNVRFRDHSLAIMDELGAYDGASASLSTGDTKVYEAVLGIDEAVAAATGLPVGAPFHFALNNVVLKDNRIPPRGYTNASFLQVQAEPVAVSYLDGQFWDDTTFRVPVGAHVAEVAVFYQTASKEYVTFLRDENHSNEAGQTLYEQWELTGKSPPVQMASAAIVLSTPPGLDPNFDGWINLDDWSYFFVCVEFSDAIDPSACNELDADADGDLDLRDAAELQLSISN